MARQIEEVELPGVGVRFSFVTGKGQRVSVLVHHSGRKQVFVGVPSDPDASREVLDLDQGDSPILAELLGGSELVHDVERLQRLSDELALDWLRVEAGSAAEGRSIGELWLRSRTNVSVVAVLRAGQTIASPGPDLVFEAGDTAVVIGRPDDMQSLVDLLRG